MTTAHSRVDEHSLRYEGWRVVFASSLAVCLSSVVVYSFPIFLKPLSEAFSWSRESVSSAYASMALMSALSAAPLGFMVDRFGTRTIVIACLALAACVFASLSLVTSSIWHLYLVFGALGILATGASPVAYARAVSTWFATRRGVALAIAISGGAIGGMVHPPLTQWLVDVVGWRITYAVLGGLILAAGVPIVAAFIRERSATSHATRGAHGVSVGNGLRSRAFWILVAVMFCSSLAQSGAIVHIAALLTDRGVSASQAALVVSLMGLSSLCGRLTTGWLMDRFFGPRVSFALMMVTSLGAFLLSDAGSFAVGALAAFCIGVGTSGEMDVAPYLLSRYFGLRSFSTLYGLVWTVHSTAAAVGPILMGRVFDATGSYEALLVQLALVTAAAATLMLAMPRYAALGDERTATV